jgi:ABC-2 type transport system ATP-binding protein
MPSSLVETHQLSKRYATVMALAECTLQIQSGEVFGLLGPNGAGKSTLLRLLMGFLRPSMGRASIDGLDCYHRSVDVHKRVSYLPGDVRLFPRMSGLEVLRFFSTIRRGGSFTKARELAERLELDATRHVAYYSTGMRQKLALAACMSMDVPLLILDEPTANLDPTIRGDVLHLVREAQAAGRTVIFSSHVLSEVEAICDRVVVLRKGLLVHDQQMSQLRRQHRIRAQLLGPLPAPPEGIAGELKIRTDGNNRLTIETPGELSPLLGWLARIPLEEVRIEPVGLQAVYDRFHPPVEM